MFGRTALLFGSLLIAAALLTGCSSLGPPEGVQVGMSRLQVQSEMGGADEVSQFEMPDQGFFGPQEELIGIVSAGSLVEQWTYQQGEDVTYVWFTHNGGEGAADWTVVATATYPADAVY